MLTKTEAIKNFLIDFTCKDLADLYHYGMEVQVNVAQDAGTRIEGEGYKGRMWHGYTDGEQTWKAIRIPWAAKSKAYYEDSPMVFDLSAHVEAIGMTGWNWADHKSQWVAFDYDGIVGHAETHGNCLSEQELLQVQEAACAIPWVTVRKSSGGKGLHLYVFLADFPTENHTEHAALGRAILSQMSAETGFDFNVKVDVCGGNMWVYHRKMKDSGGLELIKQGSVLDKPPLNWRDHLDVVRKKSRRNKPSNIDESNIDEFEEMTGQRARVVLDSTHKKLMDYLNEINASWWWDSDHWMLVCHTFDLKKAHEDLSMRGVFDTLATGKDKGADWNCFAFPIDDQHGAWNIRRYTQGAAESSCWEQDSAGWTQCYFNRDPTLRTAARTFDGIEDEKGSFHFNEAEVAQITATALGANLNLPNWACSRETVIKQHKDGRLVVHVKAKDDSDNPADMKSWRKDKGWWKKLFSAKLAQVTESNQTDFDNIIRHLTTSGNVDFGWALKANSSWATEPLQHIKIALQSMDISEREIKKALGSCVMQPWQLVNEPFQNEYPGGRRWNRESAQFVYIPQEEPPYNHGTWDLVLKHCGNGLDSTIKENGWCQTNGIDTGEDYLRVWIASLFQYPKRPLPYLFLYSKTENTGKSTLHEALSFLINGAGYARADHAMTNPQGFNGEMVSAVLCVIQETDLRKSVGSRNKLKDWVTALKLPIHVKNRTPYLIPNTTHYIHTANDHLECPIFPGDSRITLIQVPPLDPLKMVPRDDLHIRLKLEAPAFMATVLGLEIPRTPDRLNVPILETQEKFQSAQANRTDFEIFLEEKIFWAPGQSIAYSELYDKFQEWLSPEEVHLWTKIKMGRDLPTQYPKGRHMEHGSQYHIGNMSFTKPVSVDYNKLYVLVGNILTLARDPGK